MNGSGFWEYLAGRRERLERAMTPQERARHYAEAHAYADWVDRELWVKDLGEKIQDYLADRAAGIPAVWSQETWTPERIILEAAAELGFDPTYLHHPVLDGLTVITRQQVRDAEQTLINALARVTTWYDTRDADALALPEPGGDNA